jgi:hypothetical protein
MDQPCPHLHTTKILPEKPAVMAGEGTNTDFWRRKVSERNLRQNEKENIENSPKVISS